MTNNDLARRLALRARMTDDGSIEKAVVRRANDLSIKRQAKKIKANPGNDFLAHYGRG
jgi:hypothetical protein